jgi:hypothetical protein
MDPGYACEGRKVTAAPVLVGHRVGAELPFDGGRSLRDSRKIERDKDRMMASSEATGRWPGLRLLVEGRHCIAAVHVVLIYHVQRGQTSVPSAFGLVGGPFRGSKALCVR